MNQPKTARAFTLQRDRYDPRDHKFSAPVTPLPAKVDLSPKCSPVEDQGSLGSCTGNAIVGNLEYLQMVQNPMAFVDLSRLFVYYNERYIEHTIRQDAGAQIRDGIKAVAHWGVCTEKHWPYNVTKFRSRPNALAFNDAFQRRAVTYARVAQSATAMMQTLAAGFPIVVGFEVYSSFESEHVAKTGFVPMPQHSEELLGGHAVLVVGYDQTTRMFKVRNSWGSGWGDKGNFYIPFDYLTNPALASDFWVIQK